MIIRSMHKIILLLLLIFFTVGDAYSYAIKVYDEYGNRVGTYRKTDEKYEFYDFNDKKIENPENIIQNPPSQKTLIETANQRIYNPDMMPIDTYTDRLYSSWSINGSEGYIFPPCVNMPRTPYIVRPRAKKNVLYNKNGYYHPNSFEKTVPFKY